jgi:SPP1 family predicted phage head-tail adaptor
MTNLSAGTLRTRAVIQRRTTDKGTRGESTDVWQEIGRASCEVEYLSGRKLELAKQLFTRATVQVKMRKPRVITLLPNDRLIANGQTLTLGAVVPKADGFNDVEILCEVTQ